MKRLLGVAIVIVAMVSTSCLLFILDDYLYDWEITPETEVVQIPQEGGTYYFEGLEAEFVGTTRFQPGELYKCLRYRLILGDASGQVFHFKAYDGMTSINIEVPANESGAERNVTLEISKAVDFHSNRKEHNAADGSEESWEEWQAVWFGIQEGK